MFALSVDAAPYSDMCYSYDGNPQFCFPQFVNKAYLAHMEATNTCGSPPEEYCVIPKLGENRLCYICDAKDPMNNHNASHLTDGLPDSWWQSTSMINGIQYPNVVNLTLDLGRYL